MREVQVSGRFVTQTGKPIKGTVHFTPDRIWVDGADGKTYPCLAPEVELIDGRFLVYLTRTDTGVYPWSYTVVTPVGTYRIRVEADGPLLLKDLIARP